MREKIPKRLLTSLGGGLLLVLLLVISVSTAFAQDPTPMIVTDKADYAPGETVYMTGTGFDPNTEYDIVVTRPDGSIVDGSGTFSCTNCWDSEFSDGTGYFEYDYILNGILGLYEVNVYTTTTPTDHTTPVASTTFTDAPWDITHRAADAEDYPAVLPGNVTCPGGGSGQTPANLNLAEYGDSPGDSLTSLTPEAMGLGQVVVFEFLLEPDNNASDETIQFTYRWDTETTSGLDFGYDDSFGVICAFVDTSDDGNVNPSGNESVIDYFTTNMTTSFEGTFTVSGLSNGEKIVVEVWVVLDEALPQGVNLTGNVQSGMADTRVCTSVPAPGTQCTDDGTTFNFGTNNISLKIGDFISADVDIGVTKSDDPDPVIQGGVLTYTLQVVNSSSNVANGVLLTDTLDSNTSFSTVVSITDTEGDVTICSHDGSPTNGDLTCDLGFLNPSETVTIVFQVNVSATAPTASVIQTGDCTQPGAPTYDLCNVVEVTTISDDTNLDNNDDSEPTDVEEDTAITLASFTVEANDGRAMIVWETGTEIDNAGFNLYRAASPDGPWVQINSKLILAEGDPVAGASYNFVDTPGRGTYYYRLEDIDFYGVSTLHDPFMAELGPVIRVPWFRPTMPQF